MLICAERALLHANSASTKHGEALRNKAPSLFLFDLALSKPPPPWKKGGGLVWDKVREKSFWPSLRDKKDIDCGAGVTPQTTPLPQPATRAPTDSDRAESV